MADIPLDASVYHVLTATPALVRDLLAGAPTALVATPVDDGWSARHVLAHLLDVEDVFTGPEGRIRRIVHEERPFIRSIDPTARMAERRLLDRSVADLLQNFERRRIEGLRYVQTLDARQLARLGDHDEAGEISGANLAWQWAYHDLMHIGQLCAILQHPLLEGMGNTRKFYDV
jgi:hypothetical protein